MDKYPYLVVEGNIGSGKTSLVKLLSSHLNVHTFYEEFSDNPFLPKFYTQPDKYAFPLELSFLAERYQQLKSELNTKDLFYSNIISDYYFYKSLIFAQINLKEDEYLLYKKLFHIIHSNLPEPNLLVYLYSDVERLKENILGRGRSYEKDISEIYLSKINNGYFNFLNQQNKFPVLVINVTNIDFVNQKEDLDKIISSLKGTYEKGVHQIDL
ncbi:MAG: deoxynucleoside kinase [Flavobacteriales bacterium]|nr:deoxynucleoside kinase [Flavobacteriales bacterium]